LHSSSTEESVERNDEEGVEEHTIQHDEKHNDNGFSTKSLQDKWLSELIEAIEDDNPQKTGEAL
jgi:hypothetical protein